MLDNTTKMDPRDETSSDSSQDEEREEGWEDVDPDDGEEAEFVSLFDNQKFPTIKAMFEYCRDSHNFDIWSIKKRHDLDFISLIQLVNFIRSQVKSGDQKPNTSDKERFVQDQYLKPVLDEDAVLYNLDDLFNDEDLHAKNEVEELREQLETLKAQFQAYREDVQTLLDKSLTDADPGPSNPNSSTNHALASKTPNDLLYDDDYFKSYSYNTIHEIMLKDAIRTDSYRDFIYENKHIFQDKIVLDVGCGTGILSMFCARAGAKSVIAVDNSDVISRAKENVRKNDLSDQITFIRGKIEEVELPVPKVDVIVSEWMGYCLLYESMLDSVLHARDKFLAPDGLMVPSHTTIRMAPLADSDLKASHIDFWRDVYGFDMTAMLERAHEEALIRVIDPKEIAADSAMILELDLHTITVKDLNFRSPFEFEWRGESQRLEGFVIWFDTFFFTSSQPKINKLDLTIEKAKQKGAVAFSTGPQSTATHWQQGILLIKEPKETFAAGDRISGEASFNKNVKQERSLDIDVMWQGDKSKSRSIQMWFLD